jgi:hypothetical protein
MKELQDFLSESSSPEPFLVQLRQKLISRKPTTFKNALVELSELVEEYLR